jgi:hypothetical protein
MQKVDEKIVEAMQLASENMHTCTTILGLTPKMLQAFQYLVNSEHYHQVTKLWNRVLP